ncbi:MAG: hypothetical protein QM778_37790 [Myxococcales bacterium]
MRFEIFLSKLPRAAADRVLSEMDEMPKGLSKGVLNRALETRTVPTVCVAFSEDKRVVNEIEDWLVSLGADCRVVDHGNIFQKLSTFVSEKLGAARYREDEPNKAQPLIKLGKGANSQSLGAELTSHALRYLLQFVFVGVLLMWSRWLAMGLEKLLAAPWLMAQLAACGVGLLASYVLVESTQAIRAGKLRLAKAAPIAVVPIALTVGSLFLVDLGRSAVDEAGPPISRPPSQPFAGLLTELRRREMAGEQPTGFEPPPVTAEQATRDEAQSSASARDALWCFTGEEVSVDCATEFGWEESQACLPLPTDGARLLEPYEVPLELEPTTEEAQPVLLPVAAAAKPRPVVRPWSLSLEAVPLALVVGAWFVALLGMQLWFERRLKRASAQGPVSAVAVAVSKEELARQASEAQLLSSLQEELARTQAASAELAAEQGALAEQNSRHESEIERLQAALAEAKEQLAEARTALVEAFERDSEVPVSRTTVANQQTAPRANVPAPARERPAPPRPQPAQHGSSYSVTAAQEERISPRRRG